MTQDLREAVAEKAEFYRKMAEKIGPEEFEIAYTRAANDLEELLQEHQE